MSTAIVEFKNEGPRDVGRVFVYTRATWGEDWSLAPDLYAIQVAWSIAPSISMAQIEMLYGTVKTAADVNFTEVPKTDATDLLGHYVKIEIQVKPNESGEQWLTRNWYGIVESVDDNQHGARTGRVTGRAMLKCMGMEYLLAKHLVDTSVIHDPDETRVDRAFGFNVLSNRNQLFKNRHSEPNANDAYPFDARAPQVAEVWTSKKIAEYLLEFQTPRDQDGEVQVPFKLSPISEDLPPDWDEPLVNAEGQTTYSLLGRVIDRRRLMVMWFDVDEDEEPNLVRVHVDTLAKDEINVSLPDTPVIPANAGQVQIVHENDPLTSVAITDTNFPIYDVIVVRGALMRAMGSFSFQDTTLNKAWSTSDEADYEIAASKGSYGGETIGTKEKQRRNAEVRNNPKFAKVFAHFEIPHTWDQKVGDGTGGPKNPLFVSPVLPMNPQVFQSWSHLFIEQSLPLLKGVKYDGDKIKDGEIDETLSRDKEELRPLVVFKRPDKASGQAQERWVKAQDVGAKSNTERSGLERAKQNERFSLSVHVERLSHELSVKVMDQPQYAIAKTDFNRLPVDEFVGHFDYTASQGMICTVSFESQTWVEARIPDTDPVKDFITRKVIYAGEQFRKDYVAPGTVVDVDEETGQLLRSTGGWLPKEAPDDNVAKLQAIAEIAAEWYTIPHNVFALTSHRLQLQEDLHVGMLITEVRTEHTHDINAIVSQITMSFPTGGPEGVEPVMQVMTWAGELDVVGPNPILPKPRKPRRPRLPRRNLPFPLPFPRRQ